MAICKCVPLKHRSRLMPKVLGKSTRPAIDGDFFNVDRDTVYGAPGTCSAPTSPIPSHGCPTRRTMLGQRHGWSKVLSEQPECSWRARQLNADERRSVRPAVRCGLIYWRGRAPVLFKPEPERLSKMLARRRHLKGEKFRRMKTWIRRERIQKREFLRPGK